KLSCWASPPERKMKMQDFALPPCGEPDCESADCGASDGGASDGGRGSAAGAWRRPTRWFIPKPKIPIAPTCSASRRERLAWSQRIGWTDRARFIPLTPWRVRRRDREGLGPRFPCDAAVL